jgi:hypothetical protein
VIHCDNHTFRINPVCKNAQVYNNILVNAPTPSDGWFVGYNLIIGNKGVPTRFDRFHVDPKFKDPEAFDGKLADDSPAIDAGTARFAPSPLHPVDFHGAPRDLRPDCGAVEMPGRSPDPEAATPVKTESVITWLDDFKDGDRAVDPWLAGKQQAGLSWTAPEGQSAWSINPSDGKNKLSAISINGLTRMRAEQGGDWTDFSVRALTLNAYNTLGAGVVLRAGPGMEGYWVDLVHARIVRMDKDADGNLRETELAAADNLLPRLEAREVLIRIIDTPQGPEIQVDAHADGTVEMKAVDTAANPIRKGGLELFNHSSNGSHRTDWLRVEVKTTP